MADIFSSEVHWGRKENRNTQMKQSTAEEGGIADVENKKKTGHTCLHSSLFPKKKKMTKSQKDNFFTSKAPVECLGCLAGLLA